MFQKINIGSQALWVSNVKFCTDFESAIGKANDSNTFCTATQEFQVNEHTIIETDKDTLESYCDFEIKRSADIIMNFKKVGNNYNRVEILIEDKVVSDIDFIIHVACLYTPIKCRFYFNDKNQTDVMKLSIDCVFLSLMERKKMVVGPIETKHCFYNNGYCIPRNIQIMYFKP